MNQIKTLLLLIYIFTTSPLLFSQCVNPTPPNPGTNDGISNVKLRTLNYTTPIQEGYTVEYDSGATIPDFMRCESDTLFVTRGVFSNIIGVWIDWNGDGDFMDTEELVRNSGGGASNFIVPISIPVFAAAGNITMRIYAGGTANSDACFAFPDGDVEDYKINIVTPFIVFDSVMVSQLATNCLEPGTINQPVLSIALYTSNYNNGAILIDGFQLDRLGTTNPLDISNAKMWYTGTSPAFNNNAIQFGTTVSAIGSPFSINGSQFITNTECSYTTHYFLLTHDISTSAASGNLIDAVCTAIDTNNLGSIIPPITDPTGACIIANGTEICNNGIDDDCDGLVDCFDSDCSGIGNCLSNNDNFFYGLPADTCPEKYPQPLQDFNYILEWNNSQAKVASTPVIGDIDNDGIPEIIAHSSTGIFILDGQTGNIESTITDLMPVNVWGNIALGDVDGDGTGELFTLGIRLVSTTPTVIFERFVMRHEHDATNISDSTWKTVYPGLPVSTLSLADLNGDGNPELFTNMGHFFDAQNGTYLGQVKLDGPTVSSAVDGRKVIVADIFPDHYCEDCSGLEIITGENIYSAKINGSNSIFNRLATIPNHDNTAVYHPATVDINGDGKLEIISTTYYPITRNFLYVWEPRLNIILNSFDFSTSTVPADTTGWLSPPSVSDIDNDGKIEFLVPFRSTTYVKNRLYAINDDMSELWIVSDLVGESSGWATPVIFDFEGDGSKEIIMLNEGAANRPNIYILDGPTGMVKDSFRISNLTSYDLGVQIADVDADGEVEMICVGEQSFANAGINILGSACNNWVCGRQVWNQYHYTGVNINDDLTIPKQQQNVALIPILNANNEQIPFRDTSGNRICPIPDIIINIDSNYTTITCDSIIIAVNICNIGARNMPADSCISNFISFYNGDPLNGGTLISSATTVSGLNINECGLDTFVITVLNIARPFDLYIVINDNGSDPLDAPNVQFAECKTINNFRNINIPVLLEVSIDSVESLCLDFDPITLSATNPGIWNGSGISDTSSGVFNPSLSGEGTFIIKNINCGYTDSIEIVVIDCDTLFNDTVYIYVPNTFTPNGDGLHDIFSIVSSNFSLSTFEVYNKWGKLLFTTTDLDSGWNGNYESIPAKEDTYIFFIHGMLIQEPIYLIGNLTLLR